MTSDIFSNIEFGMLPFIYYGRADEPKENHYNSVDGTQLENFCNHYRNSKQGKFVAYLPPINFNRKEYKDLELVIFENDHYYVTLGQFSKERLTDKALDAIKESKVLKDFIEFFKPLAEGIKEHRLREILTRHRQEAQRRFLAAQSSINFIDDFIKTSKENR